MPCCHFEVIAMRLLVRTLGVFAVLFVLPTAARAQVTLAGAVTDNTGAVLPGVTVEASSPALIEKVRTATTDGNGRYRIENLRPGEYTLTFTLNGFATVKREKQTVSGTGVVTADVEMRPGVQETITVTGEVPVVDVESTQREVTLDNETMRALPSVRSYSYLLNTVPGVTSNNNNVNTGPVFAIFPVHGGRGVESRLTVDGLNISNPPGGNQPPNFTADVGNAQEVTMTTSGGLGEAETAGLAMNIVPKQGGNRVSGLAFISGFSEGMQSDNFTDELKARGATQPNPVYHVYDVNASIGGPIMKDKLWYYMSVRQQGQRQNTLNVYYNQNAGDPNSYAYVPDLNKPAFSDRTWENYTPRITWQATPRNKFTGSWDEQPVCRNCSGTTSLTGSPNFIFPTSPEADGHGEFSPQRVQQVRWSSPATNKLLLEAGLGSTYYQWGGRELDPNPTRDLVQVLDFATTIVAGPPPLVTPMVYRSQSWLNNRTRGTQWAASASYITGSHSLKFGYQGNYWRDDRQMFVNNQDLRYTFFAGAPSSITEYANGYNVNARAMQASLYAQDQWTFKRLTLQGALRWDHPWSWFPEQVEPASRFFPGVTLARSDGVTGYNDITPRMGAAYDLFGSGKTAIKVNVGKYLQGASVSNLAYNFNPALRIPGGDTTFGGVLAPSTTRSWTDANHNFVPDCDLTNPNGQNFGAPGTFDPALDSCGPISNSQFGSNQLVGATFDPKLLSGWGVRPADWSYGFSVQQQIVPRASVEVGYYRRTFTQYTTGGTVTDNLALDAGSFDSYTVTAPTDSRLPGGGGYTVGPLYNINPSVFGQSNLLIKSTKDVGNDTRVFDGVDVTVNMRAAHGVTFQGGTSTGKVVNDWCDIRNKVPETTVFGASLLLNPYCHQESPWLTSFNALVTYLVPKIDVNVSSVFQNKPNVSIDQLGSLMANYTLTPADQAAALAQLPQTPGYRLTATPPITVNLISPGVSYGDRITQWDLAVKKIIRISGQRLTVGLDIYNMLNNNVTLAFNQTFNPAIPTGSYLAPTSYMNPRVFRLNAEFAW
jgi:hypothetical protein